LKGGQDLYKQGQEDQFVYFILFGRFLLNRDDEQIGKPLNAGWTLGEEALYAPENPRKESCVGVEEGCLLAISGRNMGRLRDDLTMQGKPGDFASLEVVLKGNFWIK